jgi:MerR family transcriptional regulator, light-induced transcriptional regulator
MEKDTYKYAMKMVSRLSGLTPFVIRSWEKRYGVVHPARTGTNRRLYSDHDVERLILLRRATEEGHSIGSIVKLEDTQLEALTRSHAHRETLQVDDGKDPNVVVSEMLAYARTLDSAGLERTLIHATAVFSRREMAEKILVPFLETVGREWHEGGFRIAQEHLASAVLRTFLMNQLSAASPALADAPKAIAATPRGQMHEMGALIAANAAADEGWNVVYLGANIPAEDIAASARQLHARAAFLSVVFPFDDPQLHREFAILSALLPPECRLIVGGRAAAAYSATLERLHAEQARDLDELGTAIPRLSPPTIS